MTAPAPPPDPRIPRDQLVRRVLTAAGLSEAVTFGFIEAKAAQAFCADGDAGALVARRQPAVGEVRHAAAVAPARPGRRRRAQPPPRPARRRRSSRSARASRRRRRDARRRHGVDRRGRRRNTGRARRARSTSSTSRASSSGSAHALGVPVRFDAGRRRRFSSRARRPRVLAPATAPIGARRSDRAGGRRRARAAAPGSRVRRRAESRSPGDARASVERARRGRCRAIRSSSAICRSSSRTPCLRRSFVAPFRRPDATAPAPLVGDRVLRSLSGQGRAGRIGQPVGAADIPGRRSHADRRRGAAERRHDSGGAGPRARRRAAITHLVIGHRSSGH